MFAREVPPGDGARRRRCGAELRVPTVFNFLGPLTNPARPYAQVVGVSDERMLPLMAEVLARRGTRAMLFRGVDGLDELTTTDLSAVYDVKDGTVRETHLDPAQARARRGSSPRTSRAATLRTTPTSPAAILEGERGPQRDVVLLNAGAALEVAGFASTPRGRDGDRRPGDRRRRRRQDARPDGSRSRNAG